MKKQKLSPTSAWSIFGVTILGLFLELTLIRWVTTEIRIFAYLQNTILVVCFLGLGMGALTSRRSTDLKPGLVRLAILIALLTVPPVQGAISTATARMSLVGGQVVWETGPADTMGEALIWVVLGLLATAILMFLVFHTFVPIGRILGRALDDHPRPILAYSVNIAGSLVGTLMALLAGFLRTPPIVWIGLIAMLTWPFLSSARRQRRIEKGLLAIMLLVAGFATYEPGAIEVTWSPYQKLSLWPGGKFGSFPGDLIVDVNGAGYQGLTDLRSDRIQTDTTGRFDPGMDGYSQYDLPMRLHDAPRRVLLVGGGTGNDAAGALRQNVDDITVVEIDPVIVELGRRYHPEGPYQNERVTIVTDDARAFFSTSEGGYDVVVFGLLDSHMNLGMTNARLDHYVYTRESIAMARDLLAPGGIAFLSFAVQKPYVADRMARVLMEVFGEKPLAFHMPTTAHGWGGTMFVSGNLEMANRNIAGDPHLGQLIEAFEQTYPQSFGYSTQVTTDDWPYLYLEAPTFPPLFLLLAMLVIGLFFLGRRMTEAPKRLWAEDGTSWHFFFLGAAFLLLEVQNISKATIVLGSTWWVNGIIISGVLVMILLANLTAARFPRIHLPSVYLALLASCGALFFLDLSQFAGMPFSLKAPVVGLTTCLPMFFSGIIFIRSFSGASQKDIAFGANLLGALVGALLQPVTFLTGVRFLLLLVGILYLASWVTMPGFWRIARKRKVALT